MGLRSQEPERINRLRTAHGARLAFAERILEFSADFFKDMWKGTVDEKDRVLVVRVLLAFHQKIVADLWGIVVLSERGLPTAAVTRDLLENVISAAYIASDNSTERARLCRNYLYEYNRRELAVRSWYGDVLFPADEQQKLDMVLFPLMESPAIVFGMQQWRETWAGRSTEELVNEAALPQPLRRNIWAFLYAHTTNTLDTDWKNLVQPADGKVIDMDVPGRVEWHLLLACDAVLVALEIVGENLGIDRQTELIMLRAEIEKLLA